MAAQIDEREWAPRGHVGSSDPIFPPDCLILQGVAQRGTIPGLTYDPATGTGTITRKGSTTCAGGTVDLSLDYSIASGR